MGRAALDGKAALDGLDSRGTTRPLEPAVIVGPFPPPIHGVSMINEMIAHALAEQGVEHECVDLAEVHGSRGLRYHFSRVIKVLFGAIALVRVPPRSRVLFAINMRWGIFYDLLLVAVARLRRLHIALYHHNSGGALSERIALRLLLQIAGADHLQIMCSPSMGEMIRRRYGVANRMLFITNAAWIEPPPETVAPGRQRVTRITLGHLGGLCEQKGLVRAIETLAVALTRGLDAHLMLAGAPMDEHAKNVIDRALSKYPERIKCLGVVSGRAKARFFQDIDYFLFPSLHPQETQSLVVPEALAAGVPVVAFGHNFVAESLSAGSGLVVAKADNFAEAAIDWIVAGNDEQRSHSARVRFNEIHAAGRQRVDELLAWLGGR